MTEYVLHQYFRYEYSAPVRQLQHRLMVVPPAVHGHQRRTAHRLLVTGAEAQTVIRRDRFANQVIHVSAPSVEEAIEFEVRVKVESQPLPVPPVLPASALRAPWFTQPSVLTRPDPRILEVSRMVMAGATAPLELAERITGWVHANMRYSFDVTGVSTTASEALAVGAGVCQDFAHVMLSISRACGLAARYVSGHLVGEGGSHAWVEVLVDADADDGGARAVAVAFDPTHDRRAHAGYLTVATGRDYADVAPTSGTFSSPGRGRLFCRKRLDVAGPVEPALSPTGAP